MTVLRVFSPPCSCGRQDRLHNAGFFVDVETSNKTLNKKVREGVTAKYNYILVVGEAEEVRYSVAVFFGAFSLL